MHSPGFPCSPRGFLGSGCWSAMGKGAGSSNALLYPWPCRVFLALCDNPKDRGTIVAQGGGKVKGQDKAFAFLEGDLLHRSTQTVCGCVLVWVCSCTPNLARESCIPNSTQPPQIRQLSYLHCLCSWRQTNFCLIGWCHGCSLECLYLPCYWKEAWYKDGDCGLSYRPELSLAV